MEQKYNALGNILINKEGNYITFNINSKIYSLKMIYQAAYTLMEKAAVVLDGDPKDKILIEIRPMKKLDDAGFDALIKEFNDELLNYASYFTFSAENQEFRNVLLNSIVNKGVSSEVVTDAQKEIEDVEKIFEEWDEDELEDDGSLNDESQENSECVK